MAADIPKRFRRPKHWTLAQLLDHHTDKSGGPDACWLWTGCRNTSGYGQIRWEGKKQLVTRLTWVEKHGRPIPAGQCVLHHCDNPPCRNESHLWPGTQADNAADKMRKGRYRGGKGAAHGSAKLTEADVHAIRAAAGSQRAIGRRFGISKTHVSNIRSGKKWAHVPHGSHLSSS